MAFDRRNFMVGSGLIAGGMMLPKITMRGAQAAMPAQAKTGTQSQGIYHTKVGATEVISVLDGPMKMDAAVFDHPNEEELAKAKADNFLKADQPFPAYIHCFIIKTPKKTIMIDTGARGMQPGMGRISAALETLGLTPDSIDEIIMTHAHPDHANGLLDEKGQKMFKTTRVRAVDQEVNFWFDPAMETKFSQKKQLFESAQKNLTPYKNSGQLETFKFGADLGNGLVSVPLPGHTPGHTGIRITDGKEQLLIWGDIVHSAFVQFEHPDQGMSFDTDVDQARATRKKIFDEVATDKLRIGGMHLAFPAVGFVAKRGQAYAFVPQTWETDI